jgi:chromosome segregation ATPase
MSTYRKSKVSARHSLSLTSSTVAERDQHAEETAEADSDLKLLTSGGRNNSELDATAFDELLRQAEAKLADEERRRLEAETEAAELRQQVDRVSTELRNARTECERLTSDLANAARANGPLNLRFAE